MSNLLLITDVARLRKIFGRLTEDKNVRLRIVNNLEQGGEEIAVDKPDIVFVQTHLSGLSAEIILMHLKKQLGRKRSRFVLLASSAQVNDAVLKQYQGWIDSSAEDSQMLSDLQRLLASHLIKTQKYNTDFDEEPAPADDTKEQAVSFAESAALFEHHPDVEEVAPEVTNSPELQHPIAVQETAEPTLEEQGITYSPRQRLKVYSEFTSSFDSAVSNTQEPETLDQVSPTSGHDWDAENIDVVETKLPRSKRGMFLLWLAPVVIAVVVITYFQQQRSAPEIAKPTTKSVPVVAPPVTPPPAAATAPVAVPPAIPPVQDQDRLGDKAMLNAIAENRNAAVAPVVKAVPANRLTAVPGFIPVNALDKQFSVDNPGWERYKRQTTEFKILREAGAIKAIQVIDRGGNGVSETFMKSALKQVTKNPILNIDTSEKKEGYDIQRGKIAENITAVYYRDEDGGKLRAFVLIWQ